MIESTLSRAILVMLFIGNEPAKCVARLILHLVMLYIGNEQARCVARLISLRAEL